MAGPGSFAPTCIRRIGEAILLGMLPLSIAAFGGSQPFAETILIFLVAVLISLWAIHAILTRELHLQTDLPTLAFAGMILLTGLQLIPLPESVVGVISPSRLDWHRSLIPEHAEVLPGETSPEPRSTWLSLTIDCSATRTALEQEMVIFLLFLATRNWLANRGSLRRLAVVGSITGALFALLGLTQALSAPPRTIYWTIPTEFDSVFGPFVNRNHAVDVLGICTGLALGLYLPRRRRPHETAEEAESLVSLRRLGLLAVIAGMLGVLPWTYSRGGMLSVVAAGALTWLLTRIGEGEPGLRSALRLGLACSVALGCILVAWLGTSALEKRLQTLWTGEALDSRWPLWRDAAQLVPRAPLTGLGTGTFLTTEPTVRGADRDSIYFYDHTHNEYLEALIDGGVLRLLLLSVLVVSTLFLIGRGFVQRRDRSVGPYLLGLFFGLAVVAFHAIVEFGIHLPAVAILAATAAGYGLAAAGDSSFVPARVRVRKTRTGDAVITEVVATSNAAPGVTPTVWTGAGAIGIALGLAVIAGMLAIQAGPRYRADQFRLAADQAFWQGDSTERVRFLKARAALQPDDPLAQGDLGQGILDQVIERSWQPAGAVAGVAGIHRLPGSAFPPLTADPRLAEALRAFRTARGLNPLLPRPHARMGQYAEAFSATEPAATHFARAKRLVPHDPDVWAASCRDAIRRKEWDRAWDDGRQSLTLSPRNLAMIVQAARPYLTTEEIRTRLIPAEPVALMRSSEVLFPDPVQRTESARLFLEGAIDALPEQPTADQWAAVAQAHEALGHPTEAANAWVEAVTLAPRRYDLREQYAQWLEREEVYDEAMVQLEWLMQRRPNDSTLIDRHDAARHGARLLKDR